MFEIKINLILECKQIDNYKSTVRIILSSYTNKNVKILPLVTILNPILFFLYLNNFINMFLQLLFVIIHKTKFKPTLVKSNLT